MSRRPKPSPAGAGRHGMAALVLDGPRLTGAACAEADRPDDWYGGPDRSGSAGDGLSAALSNAKATDRARRVCARCPAITACLGWALDRRELWGVFGGLDPVERNAVMVPKHGGRRDLAAALVQLGDYGADTDALVDLIARRRAAREVA